MKHRPLHVHLENLSSKPAVFALTPQLIRSTRRHNRDLRDQIRFTAGEDFANLEHRLKTAQVLVTSSDVIRDQRFPRSSLADAAPQLRLLHLIGAGVEGVLPLDWLPRGVRLSNNSGVHARKAREFLLMSLLALNSRLPAVVSNQRHSEWKQIFTPLISAKKLLVIGLGDLGMAAVQAGRVLDLTISGVSRSRKKVAGVTRVYRSADICNAVRNADFVVVAAPLTPETRNLVSARVLACTKRGVGIINMGRAAVMDYRALSGMLRNGHVSGAILDVFAPEPLPAESPLWSTPNLIISPHISSDDCDGYMIATMNLVCRNLRRMISGRALENVVSIDKQY